MLRKTALISIVMLVLTLSALSLTGNLHTATASSSAASGTAVTAFAAGNENNTLSYNQQQKPEPPPSAKELELYRQTVKKAASMTGNPQVLGLVQKYGLTITNVTWEDTGRYKGSCVGPNISDMTIQAQLPNPQNQQKQPVCMPVIRYNNFSDKTADISPDRFYLLVGNEQGKKLRKITLREFLQDVPSHLSDPGSWKGQKRSLLAGRDSHVLVSAQACFLPVPYGRKAEFNPVLFNYQSYRDNPAVLTILASREGTSTTIIDNTRDGYGWGQRLFFNQKGQRSSLTGTRMSDYLAGQKTGPGGREQGGSVQAAGQKGLNMVLLIQVPLKQKKPMTFAPMYDSCSKSEGAPAPARSSVEEAVIGHGKVEGPFTEIAGLDIMRDEKFPIRVTVQFYKATSDGVVSGEDLSQIAAQIDKVYKNGDYVGSLVTSGDTGRPTEYEGEKFEPPGWWDAFWKRHQANTTMTPEETIRMLRKLYGPSWTPRSEKEMNDELWKLNEQQK